MDHAPRFSEINNLYLHLRAGSLLAAACGYVAYVLHFGNDSLPQLSGEVPLTGVNEQIKVSRGKPGLSTTHAKSRVGEAFANGFILAQELYFQLGILRRQAEGTLSEMLGIRGLELDKAARHDNFVHLVNEIYKKQPCEHKVLLQANRNGLNLGGQGLKANKPYEYPFLDVIPQTCDIRLKVSHQYKADTRLRNHESTTVDFVTQSTAYGPVIEQNKKGDLYVWSWLANSVMSFNFNLFEVELATSAKRAIELLSKTQLSQFEAFIADVDNNIAWTSLGQLRTTLDIGNGKIGTDALQHREVFNAEQSHILQRNAHLEAQLLPVAIPNNRVGARQKQSGESIQVMYTLNHHAAFQALTSSRHFSLDCWQQLLLNILHNHKDVQPELFNKYKQLVDSWNCSLEDQPQGYIFIRAFRDRLPEKVFSELLTLSHDVMPIEVGESYAVTAHWEVPHWEFIHKRLAHLPSKNHKSWQLKFLDTILALDVHFEQAFGGVQSMIGSDFYNMEIENLAESKHILLDLLISLLETIIPGDSFLLKLREKSFGATVCIVLTPGQSSQSLISMRVGQSTNPLFSYWPEGLQGWAADRPASILPGDTKYTLFIKPLSHARASVVATRPEQQESDS